MIPLDPVCDFCNTDDPVWRYPAPGFEMADFGSVKIESRGGWLACETCAALIEDADGLALTRRSAQLYCEWRELRSSNAVDLVAAGMAEIHDRFLALRGERVPL